MHGKYEVQNKTKWKNSFQTKINISKRKKHSSRKDVYKMYFWSLTVGIKWRNIHIISRNYLCKDKIMLSLNWTLWFSGFLRFHGPSSRRIWLYIWFEIWTQTLKLLNTACNTNMQFQDNFFYWINFPFSFCRTAKKILLNKRIFLSKSSWSLHNCTWSYLSSSTQTLVAKNTSFREVITNSGMRYPFLSIVWLP